MTSGTEVRYRGLSETEVENSRREHGSNSLSPPRRRSFISHFFKNLNDPVIKVLLIALAVNIIFMFRRTDWLETLGIAVSVFLATLISTLSEYGSESAFSKLNADSENYVCRVRRAGRVYELTADEIVVGDIVLLSSGDKIPADGFIVSGRLSVDQSSMTGESREFEKHPHRSDRLSPDSVSALLRGCPVLMGEGEMEVAVVGDSTFIGQIAHEIRLDTRQSPLKLRLSRLAGQISRLGYCAAALVALVYLTNEIVLESGMSSAIILSKLSDVRFMFGTLLDAFMLGLTVIVVAVPEGLPMMIAVVLSSNIKKMVRDMVLVRKPVGIEAAGSMNILFTDKTGTLTEGRLEVTDVFTASSVYPNISELKRSAGGIFEQLRLGALYNTSSEISGNDAVGGNSTERAILKYVIGNSEGRSYRLLSKEPFDSEKKYSIASIDANGGTLLVKGAPERILPHVRYALLPSGQVVSFDRAEFCKRLSAYTAQGARVIVCAYSDRLRFSELTLVCGIVLADKIRPAAARSVETLSRAGIQVVMITGDNVDTARSIASHCGILTKSRNICLTSDELSRMTDTRLSEILPNLAVVARALPNDKSRLVRIAQDSGLVCGMTGDGINDAPALKRADIGFSMGGGTQVAKEAGDIIILDNDLASIVKAVLYGRNIFKSIRKFITLQLTMNLCAVGVSMIGPFIGVEEPVTVVQMLWINIIMDTLGGLAFAGEPALLSCMSEKPKRRDEPILNSYMINEILVLGGFTIVTSLAFLKTQSFISHFRPASDNIYLLTAFFAFFIFASVFNCFNARTDRLNLFAGIGRNKAFTLIMIGIMAIQIAFVYLGGGVLRTAPLYFSELMRALSIALLVFPAELARKVIWKIFFGGKGY